MLLKSPVIITSRLMAGVQIANGTISIEYSHKDGHRMAYRYYIDLPSGEFTGNDLSTGCRHGLQHALETLLTFLSAAAESYQYHELRGDNPMTGENSSLFPEAVVKWAADNGDEIMMLQSELEEIEGLIVE